MLWPQAQSVAKRASPMVPFRGQRDRWPSVFMWPISASMALRRRRSEISSGVRPRRVPRIVQDHDLVRCFLQGVAIARVARKAAHTDHKALVRRRGHADLAAELIAHAECHRVLAGAIDASLAEPKLQGFHQDKTKPCRSTQENTPYFSMKPAAQALFRANSLLVGWRQHSPQWHIPMPSGGGIHAINKAARSRSRVCSQSRKTLVLIAI